MTAGCLFCQRDDPQRNRVVAWNETCYARLDNYPATRGHIEVVPNRHVESFWDLTQDEAADMYRLLRTARDINEQFLRRRPDGYTIGVNEGRAAGRTIDHVHIHLIPRFRGDVADPRGGVRQCAPNNNPDAWAT